MTQPAAPGPLSGIRVVEIAGLGAGPYAGMLLSDLGADVIRVDRPGTRARMPERYALSRGRDSITLDLKQPDGLDALMTLVEQADAIFEGFRPGVAEKLGFGPDVCLARNPSIVYGRMTGWGQSGPMAAMAGHDLNYLGLTGALMLLRRPGESQPATPPGLIADFGGGGLMLALGIVAALLSSRATGEGQVVDAAMVDGVASLTTVVYSMAAQGRWFEEPGRNFCDGSAPYYETYATADDRYLAVAPIEPQFYAELLRLLELDPATLPDRDDPANWPALKEQFAAIFRTRTQREWEEVFAGSDACVTPVLTLSEAPHHPHLAARATHQEQFGVVQPSPAPRFSRTPAQIAGPPPAPGAHTRQVLDRWGFAPDRIAALLAAGAAQDAGDPA